MAETRRTFLKLFAPRFGGACAVPALAFDAGDELGELYLQSIENRILSTRPDEVARAFLEAPTGTLMLFYQIFFPVYVFTEGERGEEGEIEKALRLEGVCNKIIDTEKPERWHRLRVLKAVGAAHALPYANESELKELCRVIVTTNRRALDHEAPEAELHREVLEILWQNLVTTLITKRGWKHLRVIPEVLREAQDVCCRYLDGTENTSVLIHAAAAAWQFLLTYERSLLSRGEVDSARRVLAIRDEVKRVGGARYLWLDAMERRYYRGRFTRQEMLPQLSETLMGRCHSSLRYSADFFVLMRLEATRLSEAKPETEYISATRAESARKGSLSFLQNYGVSPEDWEGLRRLGDRLELPSWRETRAYGQRFFADYESMTSQSEFERAEAHAAQFLAREVPFRRLEEVEVSDASCSRRALFSILAGAATRSDVWKPITRAFLLRRGVGSDTKALDEKASSAVVRLNGCLDSDPGCALGYDRMVSRLSEEARAENVHKTTFAVPDNPGSARFPRASGEPDAPGEGSTMSDLDQSNQPGAKRRGAARNQKRPHPPKQHVRRLALKFHSRQESGKAIDVIWGDPALREEMPQEDAGGYKLIIPEDWLPYLEHKLKNAGVSSYTVTENLDPEPSGDIVSELRTELKRKRGEG